MGIYGIEKIEQIAKIEKMAKIEKWEIGNGQNRNGEIEKWGIGDIREIGKRRNREVGNGDVN